MVSTGELLKSDRPPLSRAVGEPADVKYVHRGQFIKATPPQELWSEAVKEAVKLKKEAFRAWLAQGSPEAARRAAASAVTGAKTRVGEEFGEAMEKDLQLASRKFWQTVPRLRKGKQGLAQAVFSRGGELLIRPGDIVGRKRVDSSFWVGSELMPQVKEFKYWDLVHK
ncbi:hypothetical protein N1851_006494 [Merluccius polli]|uniref:Uncharacterized protein n=1 Tax=Merluccius polli TaxID=89951 RepID=A0AA47N4K1_MERPO|nr:hypothetical protein N1851_006494 [Merluccius polli]